VLVAAVLLAATTASAGDDDRAFVEVTAPRAAYYVGEPVRVTLRFGVDAEFLRTNAIQLFQQPLDVPVQIDAPWLGALAATPLPAGAPRLTFALNGGPAEAAPADRARAAFTVAEAEWTFVPDRAGDVTFEAPRLRYAFATRFDDGELRGRVALDRQDVVVEGRPLTVSVLPIPLKRRPPGWTGAVGRFSLRAATSAAEVTAGEPFKLTLRIEGEGNLETLAAPRLDGRGAFHVLGAIDDHARPVRTIVYEVAALQPGTQDVPEIELAYFDTTSPAQFRVAGTGPIPLTVRPGAKSPAPPAPPAVERPDATALFVAAALAAAFAGAIVFARRRRAAAAAPAPSPVRAAAAALRTGVRDGDPQTAFAEFLGACLGVPTAAVIAPDLAARLAAAGVPGPAAARAASLLDSLVAARYGGGPAAGDARAAVLASAAEIEAALDRPVGGAAR
jgi:hypothetical protein